MPYRSRTFDIPVNALESPTHVPDLQVRLQEFRKGLNDRESEALKQLFHRALKTATLEQLETIPPEIVLDPGEICVFDTVRRQDPQLGLRPTVVAVMKSTRLCNLRCTYCHSWRDGPNQIMGFEILARATFDILSDPGVSVVDFVWHGGEATLLPVHYYQKAIWLQRQFRRPGQRVHNSIQTNGTLLNVEWLELCQRLKISLGISLDGPPEIHDQKRLDAQGHGSFARVKEGLELTRSMGVEYGVLVVVDGRTVRLGGAAFVNSLLELGVEDVGLLNVVPSNESPEVDSETFLGWKEFVRFLLDVYRCWWPQYRHQLRIRELGELISKVHGGPSQTCYFHGDCMGGFLTVEPSGDISACDKYLGDPGYTFLNLKAMRLSNLGRSRVLTAARAASHEWMRDVQHCPWFSVCQGACPHDRYLRQHWQCGGAESCCGLAPLLEEIRATTSKNRTDSTTQNQER
jgi:uncharacterized protein